MSLDRYLAGEDGALQAAILECRPLADQMVVSFLEKAPGFGHLEDDLKGECYLKLVEAIPAMRESQGGEIHNPQGYLSRTLHRSINEFIDEDGRMGIVSDRSQRRAYHHNKNSAHSPISVPDVEAVSPLHADRRVCDEREAVELRMTINDCCRSRDEQMIVDMRVKGYTIEEIEQELGIPHSSIHRMLSELQTRVEKAIA